MDFDLLTNIVAAMPVFLFSLVFHEYAHAAMASRLGDPTAAWQGRLSLDPMVHIDPVGSLLMPILGLVGGFIFGWAKPVPYNPANLRAPSRDQLLIAIAGPVSNLLLLVLFAAMLRVVPSLSVLSPSIAEAAAVILWWGVFINAILAAFNMIPLPPLDGSKVLAHFLRPSQAARLLGLDPTLSMVAILALVFTGVLTPVLVLLQRFAGLIVGA